MFLSAKERLDKETEEIRELMISLGDGRPVTEEESEKLAGVKSIGLVGGVDTVLTFLNLMKYGKNTLRLTDSGRGLLGLPQKNDDEAKED